MTAEKKVSYTTTNTYDTLNTFSPKTKNVWLVFHGMGYLSRYFIHHFAQLDAAKNFIVAPQAPSKYYQGKNFKHVGASWLTRENTVLETENVLAYVDQVFKTEKNISYKWVSLKELKEKILKKNLINNSGFFAAISLYIFKCL